jgi:site-specific DNA recombinase
MGEASRTERGRGVEDGAGQKRVALYLRVSTPDQVEHGFSVPEQRRDLLAYAEREAWTVVDVIVDEGHSGAVGIRPGLDQVLEMAEAGEIDLVLAKKRNRLFRDRYIRMGYERSLLAHGVRLVALDDTGNRFADAMNDEFADWFREEVTKNTRAGRMEKARQGKLIAAYKPTFGFAFTPDREGYVVVPHEMALVRKVIETVVSKGSLNGTKRALEREGVPAPGGGLVWRPKTIRGMVWNDAYRPHPFAELEPMLTAEAASRLDSHGEYGIWWYPRTRVTRLDPDPARDYQRPRREARYDREEQVPIPVVSSGILQETIDAARESLRDNRASRYTGDRINQLAGIVRCAECGYRLVTNRKVAGGKIYTYYRCSNHQRNGSRVCTMNKNFPADDLERAVLHAVLDAVKDRDELIEKANETFEREKTAILRSGQVDAAEYHRRLDALERQRASYQRAYAENPTVFTLDDLAARTAELDAERSLVERLVAEREDRAKRLQTLEENRDRAVEQIRRGEWGKLGITAPEARRERYREIGLRAEAAADGTVRLSWGLGEEAVLSTTDPNSPRRSRARCRRSRPSPRPG